VPSSEAISLAIYTDPDKLIQDLCPKANDADVLPPYSVPYQPREEGRDIQRELNEKLNVHRFLLIKGPTGVGKTREAAELARAKMRQGYRVLRVTSGWLDAPTQPLRDLEGHRNVLLLLDDLNRLISDSPKQPSDATEKPVFGFASFHERLQKLLEALDQRVGNTLRAIATARDDEDEWEKITPGHPVWSRFEQFALRPMSPACYEVALVKIGEHAGAQVVEADVITGESNLKPQTLVMNVRKAASESVALTPQNATPNEDRSHREEYERAVLANRAVPHVYAAVELLRQAHIEPFTWLVGPSAGHLAGWNRLQRRRNKDALDRAMRSLHVEGERIKPRDGQIEAAQAQVTWQKHVKFLHRLIVEQVRWRGKDIVSACMGFSVPLYENKDYARAEALMRAAIAADPKYALAHYNLGLILSKRGRSSKAERAFRTALASDPMLSPRMLAQAHYSIGVVLQARGRSDEAEQNYLAALNANPKLAEAHTNLGILLANRGRWDEAEQAFQAAIDADPKRPGTYYVRHYASRNLSALMAKRGRLLAKRGHWDEAEQAYRAAIAANPLHLGARINLVLLRRKQG